MTRCGIDNKANFNKSLKDSRVARFLDKEHGRELRVEGDKVWTVRDPLREFLLF
jgi:hypothetical protein